MPSISKLLQKFIILEDEYIRQIIKRDVHEIKNPIGGKDHEDVVLEKKLLVEKFQSIMI